MVVIESCDIKSCDIVVAKSFVVVITTAQLYSTKYELRFSSAQVQNLPEVCQRFKNLKIK